ncbi:tRNA 2-thiouridine(34) synthase MnmA, partial [Patescibacteria group bacterium]|nr:tRNA 2-thiouridine(34) synthase MnmA [Patescibacteria group bacterium]
MISKKKKILMCMSGGVDSSVAAVLLLQKGYDVTGAFMVNYDDKNPNKSCWRSDYQDALRMSAKLGIKLLRLDFQKEYKKFVLDYTYKEYTAGRTPNPDVLCNKFIKFGAWLDKAKELGFDYLATGHYARVKQLTINN